MRTRHAQVKMQTVSNVKATVASTESTKFRDFAIENAGTGSSSNPTNPSTTTGSNIYFTPSSITSDYYVGMNYKYYKLFDFKNYTVLHAGITINSLYLQYYTSSSAQVHFIYIQGQMKTSEWDNFDHENMLILTSDYLAAAQQTNLAYNETDGTKSPWFYVDSTGVHFDITAVDVDYFADNDGYFSISAPIRSAVLGSSATDYTLVSVAPLDYNIYNYDLMSVINSDDLVAESMQCRIQGFTPNNFVISLSSVLLKNVTSVATGESITIIKPEHFNNVASTLYYKDEIAGIIFTLGPNGLQAHGPFDLLALGSVMLVEFVQPYDCTISLIDNINVQNLNGLTIIRTPQYVQVVGALPQPEEPEEPYDPIEAKAKRAPLPIPTGRYESHDDFSKSVLYLDTNFGVMKYRLDGYNVNLKLPPMSIKFDSKDTKIVPTRVQYWDGRCIVGETQPVGDDEDYSSFGHGDSYITVITTEDFVSLTGSAHGIGDGVIVSLMTDKGYLQIPFESSGINVLLPQPIEIDWEMAETCMYSTGYQGNSWYYDRGYGDLAICETMTIQAGETTVTYGDLGKMWMPVSFTGVNYINLDGMLTVVYADAADESIKVHVQLNCGDNASLVATAESAPVDKIKILINGHITLSRYSRGGEKIWLHSRWEDDFEREIGAH